MQYLKNYSKHLLLLAVSGLMYAGVQAQTGTLIATQKNGKLFVSDGVTKKMVAASASNMQPVVAVGHVFYINNAVSNKMTIKAYDAATGSNVDVVKAETLNSGTPTDKKITNIVFDKAGNRLYFSTVSVNAGGFENYITWYLDETTNEIVQFADGKIASVDNAGTIQVEMHGVDPQGAFVQTHVKNMNGTPGTMGTRKYVSSAQNAANN